MSDSATGQAALASQVELTLIETDLRFFYDLARAPDLEPIRPVAILALMPFLSTFVLESAAYAEAKEVVTTDYLRPHQALLHTSRMRVKLLDDTRQSFDEILATTDSLAAIVSAWLLEGHSGLLGWIKRRFQPDLGIYFLGGDVFCTTHVAFMNLGLTEDALSSSSLSPGNLGPHLRDVSTDFGRYISLLMGALNIDRDHERGTSVESMPPIGYRDLKSVPFYAEMAHRVAPERVSVALLLTVILSQVNTARLIVPLIVASNSVAFLKFGFISLFHAASSLQKLLTIDRQERFLQSDAARHIEMALRHASVRSVRKKRTLRNTFMHYGVDQHVLPRLSSSLRLNGLVEACAAEASFESTVVDVAAGLDCISQALTNLLPDPLTPAKLL